MTIAKIPLINAIINPETEQICIGTVEKLVAIFPYNFISFKKEYPERPIFLSSCCVLIEVIFDVNEIINPSIYG